MESDSSNQKENNSSSNSSVPQDAIKYTPWNPEHEKILIEWADKAMCYRWLHGRSHTWYSWRNAYYTIPVIIISTLTGTANFAQSRVPVEYQDYFGMAVGGFNLLGGIVTTVQQFLKITQLNESHRVSTISWDKFNRNIKLELTKHPEERVPVKQMLKMCKEEFDRLTETSPIIPDRIIGEFKKKFIDPSGNGLDIIKKPEICDILIPTELEKNPWYSQLQSNSLEYNQTKTGREKTKYEKSEKIVNEFKNLFLNMNFREATETEIVDNLNDQLDIEMLKKILENQQNNYPV
jgi:hypothetical protein